MATTKEQCKQEFISKKLIPLNLVFLGATGVGKTTTVWQLQFHQFVEEYDPTIEDVHQCCIRYTYEQQLQTSFVTMIDSYDEVDMQYAGKLARDCRGMIWMCSVTDRQSLDIVVRCVQIHFSSMLPEMMVLVNKIDAPVDTHQFTVEQARESVPTGVPVFGVSGKLRTGLDNAMEHFCTMIHKRVAQKYEPKVQIKPIKKKCHLQ